MDARRIGLIGLAIVIPLAVAIILVSTLLDPERYRGRIEEQVSERLNATLHIRGPLRLSWFPPLGLSAGDVVLEQDGTELGRAEAVELRFDLWSLLRGAPGIRAVRVSAPELTLRRTADGQLNLQVRGEGGGDTVALETLEIEQGRLQFSWQTQAQSHTLTAENLTLALNAIRMHPGEAPLPARFTLDGDIEAGALRIDELAISDVRASMQAQEGMLTLADITGSLFDGGASGRFEADYRADTPAFSASATVSGFSLQAFLRHLSPAQQASGRLHFTAEASTQGQGLDNWLRHLNGGMTLRGEALVMQGMDIDQELSRYQSTQRFNLVDLGALAFAGPVGIAATKGADFARLFDRSGGETRIREMISTWTIRNGIAEARDTAFATERNRLVMLGSLDLGARRFSDAEVAVVDRRGCAIMRQGISGPFAAPEVQSVNYIRALLGAPLDLLRQGLSLMEGDEDCTPVYTGSIAAP